MIRAEAAELEGDVLRRTFSCFPSGVTAVCGLVEGQPVGMAASSFTSVSLDPPVVLVCMSTTSTTWRQLRDIPRLGVSVLSEGHDVACRQLASKDGDRFADIGWTATSAGAVVLHGVAAWLECEVEQEILSGDHWVVLLRIHALGADTGVAPLVFHRSTFCQLAAATG